MHVPSLHPWKSHLWFIKEETANLASRRSAQQVNLPAAEGFFRRLLLTEQRVQIKRDVDK
jgi:hypothetical protein